MHILKNHNRNFMKKTAGANIAALSRFLCAQQFDLEQIFLNSHAATMQTVMIALSSTLTELFTLLGVSYLPHKFCLFFFSFSFLFCF